MKGIFLMNKKTMRALAILLALLLSVSALAGCKGVEEAQTEPAAPPAETAETQPAQPEQTAGSDLIAGASEQTTHVDVVDESYVPIPASAIRNGTYDIEVDSSSSMFSVTSCKLTVDGDDMTAVMTMGGHGYRYIFPGTPEEAVAASEDAYILPVEDADGAHTFTIPVEALDAGIDCAAFSDNKEKWYDRVLVFRSSSLQISDYEDGFLTTAGSLELADGEYTCEVTLSGGSGKASVESPAKLVVSRGQATATLVWSSDKYDYMLAGDQKILPVSTDGGHSVFEVPVEAFDFNLVMPADTIAMSTPHEIEYTLRFDSSTIR